MIASRHIRGTTVEGQNRRKRYIQIQNLGEIFCLTPHNFKWLIWCLYFESYIFEVDEVVGCWAEVKLGDPLLAYTSYICVRIVQGPWWWCAVLCFTIPSPGNHNHNQKHHEDVALVELVMLRAGWGSADSGAACDAMVLFFVLRCVFLEKNSDCSTPKKSNFGM